MTVSRFDAGWRMAGNQRFHIGFSLSLIHKSDRIKIVQKSRDLYSENVCGEEVFPAAVSGVSEKSKVCARRRRAN